MNYHCSVNDVISYVSCSFKINEDDFIDFIIDVIRVHDLTVVLNYNLVSVNDLASISVILSANVVPINVIDALNYFSDEPCS